MRPPSGQWQRHASWPCHCQGPSRIGASARARGVPSFGSEAAADTVAALGMVHQDLELAAAVRAAVEGALRRGRCGTDADSRAAPRRDPRARRDLGAARGALRRNANGVRRVRGKCDVLGAGSCLYVHRPCVKLLYRSYSKTSGDSDALTSSIFSTAPLSEATFYAHNHPLPVTLSDL